MKTVDELEKEITKITSTIHNHYPELIKYISEMPVTLSVKEPDQPDVKSLLDYYNSLAEVVLEYAKTHGAKHNLEEFSRLEENPPTLPPKEKS